jgi:hypothetical protein
MDARKAHSATFWLGGAVLAVSIGLLITALLYLNVVFPLWEFFRPAAGSPDYEAAGEWRMLWFSLGMGAIAALGILVVARRYRSS